MDRYNADRVGLASCCKFVGAHPEAPGSNIKLKHPNLILPFIVFLLINWLV
jgi:hypothetical protein